MDTIAVGLPGEAEPVTKTAEPESVTVRGRIAAFRLAPPRRFRPPLYGGVALIAFGLIGYAILPSSQVSTRVETNSVTIPAPKPTPGASTLATPELPAKPATPAPDAMSELAALKAGKPESAPEPAPVASAPPAQPTPAPAPVQEVVVKAPAPPADPVQIATSLTPEPMTPPQQLAVLGLVREMGVVVRDQRQEIAALRKTVADLGGRIGEFDQRLSLAEARGAVAAAMGAPVPAPERHAERAPEATPVVHHYRVQAASPGLAMLSVTDPGPDGAGPVQVQVGEQVPGYGKVKSIAQHGTTWRVLTERGSIE